MDNFPPAQSDVQTRRHLSDLVTRLESTASEAVVSRIVQDLADISTPLKLFTEAVLSGDPSPHQKRALVEQRGQALKAFAGRLCKTANVVAFANARNARRAEALRHLSSQVIFDDPVNCHLLLLLLMMMLLLLLLLCFLLSLLLLLLWLFLYQYPSDLI